MTRMKTYQKSIPSHTGAFQFSRVTELGLDRQCLQMVFTLRLKNYIIKNSEIFKIYNAKIANYYYAYYESSLVNFSFTNSSIIYNNLRTMYIISPKLNLSHQQSLSMNQQSLSMNQQSLSMNQQSLSMNQQSLSKNQQ